MRSAFIKTPRLNPLIPKDRVVWLALLWLLTGLGILASPFAKRVQFLQPDGAMITLWGQGDEFSAVFETLDGYTVLFVPEDRAYHYARLAADGAILEPSGVRVGATTSPPPGLPQHLRVRSDIARAAALQRFKEWDKAIGQTERWTKLKARTLGGEPHLLGPPSFQTVGVKCGLTILIDFEDERGTYSREEISDLLNGDNYTRFGNNGSVKEYFRDVSNGRLTFTNVVTPYITIPNSVHPRNYYNDPTKDCGLQGAALIRDALNVMKKLPNFTNDFLPLFDAITVDSQKKAVSANFFVAGMSSGVWGKGIWGHSWALSYSVGVQYLSPGGKLVDRYELTAIDDPVKGELCIMVFCHENGHLLCGFPDIYDYDGDSSSGAGTLCLMAGGQAWLQNPSQVCAYLKTAAGWADVVDLPLSTNFQAVVSSTGPGFNQFLRFRKPGVRTEYFLLENRQRSGRDANILSSGIAVWHVDELGNRDNQSLRTNASHLNYEVSLEQADNQFHLNYSYNPGDSADLFHRENPSPGYANAFSDMTFPSANWWDGTRSGLVLSDFSTNGESMTLQVSVEPLVVKVDPVDVTVEAGQPAAFGFAVSPGIVFTNIQWYRDGVALDAAPGMTGVNYNRLALSAVTPAHAGQYTAAVMRLGVTNWTRPARLTVLTTSYLSVTFGSGTTTLRPDGVELTAAAATRFGGNSDSFRFACRQLEGDFDVKVLALGITMKGVQSRAGLMVRAALNPTSPHFSLLNGYTPDGLRCEVLARYVNAAPNQGLLSLLSPPLRSILLSAQAESWLRLRKEGNRLTAYRSEDGEHWVWLKSVECDLGDAPYVGVVLASGASSTEAASASFRQYQVSTNSPSTLAIFNPDGVAREGSFDDAHIAVHSSGNGPLQVGLVFAGDATNGVDYLADSQVLIPQGTNVGVLAIRSVNDTRAGFPRTIQVSLGETTLEKARPGSSTVLLLNDETTGGGLIRQTYPDIQGVTVSELTRQVTNDVAMTSVHFLTAFETGPATNTFGDGQVLSGYLIPPQTGNYVFYLASEDNSELWLSPDENPANARRVARVAGFTLFRNYSAIGNCSQAIPLEAGRYYYIRGLTKNSWNGGDWWGKCFFSVAWQLPGGAPPEDGSDPIEGKYLAFALPSAPAVELAFPDDRNVELICPTADALTCVLEASADFHDWQPVWTNALPATLDLRDIDQQVGTPAIRWYRAVMR